MSASRIDRVFLRGLATILPVTLTLYIVWWLVSGAENVLGSLIRTVLPDAWYWHGMGILMGVLLVFVVGLFMSAWFARSVYGLGERLLERIPIVKSIYGMLRDMLGFFTQQKQAQFSHVVLVRFGEHRILGLVTREDLGSLPFGIGGDGKVCVYIPMSYQIGGFTFLVPRTALTPVAMSMEEAMRFAVTAGM
jgi:uncharacterized membrane protein